MSRVGIEIRIASAALLVFVVGILLAGPASAENQLCDVNADYALGREDYPTAILLHSRLVQSQPNNALAHYHLGFAYGMVGRGSEELNEYRTAARLGLNYWDLFLNLGFVYLGQHQIERAEEALETAVSLGPEHPEAHLNLALVYENEHRLARALREITIARRLLPQDPDIANANALILVETGDLIGAREIWTNLVALSPDYLPARANLSILNGFLPRIGQLASHTEHSSGREGSAAPAPGNRDVGELQAAVVMSGRLK
jgi:tetratricopeptide (TPR) repeat protein